MAINQRSDVCAVPAAGVVAEAMVALVLADAVLEKFGGDSRHRDRPQRRRATWRPIPRADAERTGEARPVLVLIGPPGAGQVHGRRS